MLKRCNFHVDLRQMWVWVCILGAQVTNRGEFWCAGTEGLDISYRQDALVAFFFPQEFRVEKDLA